MMMRREYPELLPEALRGEARKLAELVRDPSELLWEIRNEPRFTTDFKSTPGGPVAYHAPCHLRAQAGGFKGRDLRRKVPGVQPQAVMEWCGHDGTHARNVEGFDASQRAGARAFADMKAAGPAPQPAGPRAARINPRSAVIRHSGFFPGSATTRPRCN